MGHAGYAGWTAGGPFQERSGGASPPVAAHLACGWTNVNRAGPPLRRRGTVLCRCTMMESELFQRALGRLEAAVERVERAAGTLPTGPAPAGPDGTRLAALEARHAKLREGASQALARLDRLIEGSQGGGA
jgi:hypothetical protein